MEMTFEVKGYEESFRTTIAGVTKQNADGTDRQALVRSLRVGDELRLVRERANPFDKFAVAVFRASGEQLGYVPRGDSRLAGHIDMGGRVSAKVISVVGGPGILGLFIKSFRKSYGCVIEITKHDLNWKEITPYLDKSRRIEEFLSTAKATEAKDALKAISMYREAVAQIVEFDKAGTLAAACRRARYPVNRLSLLLEKFGHFQAAYDEIIQYERFNDAFGLTAAEKQSMSARKLRLSKKLKIKDQS